MIGLAMTESKQSSSTGGASQPSPTVRFLSLFVPDLERAARFYEEVFGLRPASATQALSRHPYAAAGPVVFDLGGVELALYQCDQRTTHPGDVGIGIEAGGSTAEIARRVAPVGGRVFFGPQPLGEGHRELAVFVLPDRHFFEVVGDGR